MVPGVPSFGPGRPTTGVPGSGGTKSTEYRRNLGFGKAHGFANGGNAKGVKAQGISHEVFVIFRAVFGPPGGREWAQNVAPGTSFRTPKYRPNPANGGPIGGKNQFWKNPALPP